MEVRSWREDVLSATRWSSVTRDVRPRQKGRQEACDLWLLRKISWYWFWPSSLVGLKPHRRSGRGQSWRSTHIAAPSGRRPLARPTAGGPPSGGRWALGIPSAENPLPDTTGRHCAPAPGGQRSRFLAGATSTDPIGPGLSGSGRAVVVLPAHQQRLRRIPERPAGGLVPKAFVRASARCTEPAQISAWMRRIQGQQRHALLHRASGSLSPIFNIQLPPFGNLFGFDEATVPELGPEPERRAGLPLFVEPLSTGTRHGPVDRLSMHAAAFRTSRISVTVVGSGRQHHLNPAGAKGTSRRVAQRPPASGQASACPSAARAAAGRRPEPVSDDLGGLPTSGGDERRRHPETMQAVHRFRSPRSRCRHERRTPRPPREVAPPLRSRRSRRRSRHHPKTT